MTTYVNAVLDIVVKTAALTLMTVLELNAAETALVWMEWTHSRVFAILALKERTALVRSCSNIHLLFSDLDKW